MSSKLKEVGFLLNDCADRYDEALDILRNLR